MVKVNRKIPIEYQGIAKEDMTIAEVQQLGNIILKQKITKFKNDWYAFWHRKEK